MERSERSESLRYDLRKVPICVGLFSQPALMASDGELHLSDEADKTALHPCRPEASNSRPGEQQSAVFPFDEPWKRGVRNLSPIRDLREVQLLNSSKMGCSEVHWVALSPHRKRVLGPALCAVACSLCAVLVSSGYSSLHWMRVCFPLNIQCTYNTVQKS